MYLGALTTHKSKSRKISAASDNDESLSEASNGLFVSDRSPAPKHVKKTNRRKSDPVKKGKGRDEMADEYQSDTGRDDGA
jgi:hypothetical protein